MINRIILNNASKLIIVIFFFVTILSAVSFAELTNIDLPDRDGIELQKITVHSAFRALQQYDSNIFLDNTDVEGDFITILSPSVGLRAKLGQGEISADYEVSQWMYWIWHDQNHLDHRLRGLMEVPINDYKLTISDTFRIFTDRAANEDSLRLKENTNNFRVGVSTQMDQLGFDVGYSNLLNTYDSNDLAIGSLTYPQRSYMTNVADLTVSYLIMPKTSIFFENDLGYNSYYETSELPDSWFDNALVGVKGKWSSKTVIDLKGGFRLQQYDNSDIMAHKNWVGPVIMGGFEYNATEDDKFTVSLERLNYESTYANNNYYTVNFAGVKYRHDFNKKWSASIAANYQLHLYPSQTTENGVTAKRYDNIFTGGVGIRYDMQKWISFELRYDLRNRYSRFDTFNYNDNIVSIRGTIGF